MSLVLLVRRCTQVLCILLCSQTWAFAQGAPVRIGIVIDGPWSMDHQQVRALFEREVVELTRGEFDVRFPADKALVADASATGVARALDRLLADPEVDMVVAGGVLASHEAGRRSSLPKPVLAPVVINASVQGIPLHGQFSGVANLSYVVFPSDIQNDLEVFAEVVPIKRVAMLYAGAIGRAIPELVQHHIDEAAQVGIEAVPLPVEGDVDALMEGLPADVDGVFIALPLYLPLAGEKGLAQALAQRRIPSFSALSTDQVAQGFMMGVHSGADVERLVRRTALSVQRILLGEKPEELPVVFSRRQQLTLNMATVRAVGADPSWGILTEAKLVGGESTQNVRRLTLVGAVQEAMRANLDLLAGAGDITVAAHGVRQATADLLPQVELAATGVVIDESRAGFLSQAEQSLTTNATLTQLLYAEGARANRDIQRYLKKERRLQLRELRLDIALAAATSYLNVLRAQTLERVQAHNLELTRSNLELARMRKLTGASGPAEVYRWESQIASSRRSVIDANAQRNVAEIALNRFLQRPLEEAFSVQETGLHDEALVAHDARFMHYMASPKNFRTLRAYMVEDALSSAPELQRLDVAIAARERALKAASRALWAPTAALSGQLHHTLYEGGEGAGTPAPGELPFPVSGDDTHWDVALNLSFPLYSGGGKSALRQQTQAELEQLRLQRQALAERVEQRIRSSLHMAGASYAGISLAAAAAVAANKNYELVKDAYGRGAVNILGLLDAQNAATLAEEGASNSAYDFLVDLMAVERAVGKFYFWASSEERDAWFAALATFAVKKSE
ncbi:MAG: outer membrane protein [Planctomycetota bacterium]|jgi:outer membrane protein